MKNAGKVIPILSYQSTAIRWFYCWECETQFKKQVCVTMRPHLLICPECQLDGCVTGNSKRGR